MSSITVYSEPLQYSRVGDGFRRRVVGRFSVGAAEWWSVSSVHGGTQHNPRIWRTTSGRWVYTEGPDAYYLTTRDARAILLRNGLREVVDTHLKHEQRGRPDVGPEVKTRLPEDVIRAIEDLAKVNGFDRSEQIAVLVIDSLTELGACPGQSTDQ
jgi:hypothetical protein